MSEKTSEQIESLKSLLDSGILTQSEFEIKIEHIKGAEAISAYDEDLLMLLNESVITKEEFDRKKAADAGIVYTEGNNPKNRLSCLRKIIIGLVAVAVIVGSTYVVKKYNEDKAEKIRSEYISTLSDYYDYVVTAESDMMDSAVKLTENWNSDFIDDYNWKQCLQFMADDYNNVAVCYNKAKANMPDEFSEGFYIVDKVEDNLLYLYLYIRDPGENLENENQELFAREVIEYYGDVEAALDEYTDWFNEHKY